ncbi:MAG: glycosyltransferase [bacterium]
MKRMRKWVVTGGHHNSALVLANHLIEEGDQVIWYGHRHAASQDQNDSAEYVEVTASKIQFHELKAGKLGEGTTFFQFIRIPIGVSHAYRLLKRDRPDAVISFGGYLGFATALAAFLLHIPIFLHEQTVVAGKANKLTSRLATRVYLTWGSSITSFPKWVKTKVVGLPIRPNILRNYKKKLFPNGKPTLLILGGKQGSHNINSKIFAHLPQLLSRYNLIHQTGTSSVMLDYERAISLCTALPPELAITYQPVGYLGESEIIGALDAADLVIGRSGAHITYELGIKGKPSVLIPYLLTHDQEQLKNARLLVSQGLSEIIGESELTFPKLLSAITRMLKIKNPQPLPLPKNSATLMAIDMRQALGD